MKIIDKLEEAIRSKTPVTTVTPDMQRRRDAARDRLNAEAQRQWEAKKAARQANMERIHQEAQQKEKENEERRKGVSVERGIHASGNEFIHSASIRKDGKIVHSETGNTAEQAKEKLKTSPAYQAHQEAIAANKKKKEYTPENTSWLHKLNQTFRGK